MLKTALLGTTILAGAAAFSGPVAAGSVNASDNLTVTLSGEYRFNIVLRDQDESSGFGRGYSFKVDEAEIKISASNTADNGLKYGVTVELQTNTDDTSNSDEVFAFIDADFGRIEMGDQDDVTDRMHLEGDSVLVGRAGPHDNVADYFILGSGGAIGNTGNDETSDATKVSYFSPRLAGFQVGISHTPDDGSNGASFTETDNDGDFEKVWGFGANYVGDFGDLSVGLSATYEVGDSEDSSGAKTEGDLETISVGGTLEYGGFAFGVGYVDFAEKGQSQVNVALGEDSGEYWNAGIAYRSGPWGVSVSYFASEKSQPAGSGVDTTVDIISLDGEYNVAPGWLAAVSVNFVEADNINATAVPVNNDGTLILLNNTFKF